MADDRPILPATGTTTAIATAGDVAAALEGVDFLINPAKALALLQLRPGDHLSDYTNTDLMIQRMALGGFGLVFLGPNTVEGGRMYALKTLRPDRLASSRDPQLLSQLFLREALTWVGIWPHANLLTAQTASEYNGVFFLKLDYAPYNLRELLQQPEMVSRRGQAGAQGRLPLGSALDWAQQIAAGLVALHTPDPEHDRLQPLVHRDLKPENVLLDEHGRHMMITDFGLAKVVLEAEAAGDTDLEPETEGAGGNEPGQATARAQNTRSQRYRTQLGAAMGTLPYMAPEQWVDAATAGPPADLYAFGVMLAELLIGRHPLADLDLPLSQDQWREAHFRGVPQLLRAVEPKVPEALEALYQALLAKRAEARPTAAEALRVLQAAASALGETPYEVPEVYAHIPDHERIFWQSWANTYGRLGLLHRALECIERALAFDPISPSSLLSYGNTLLRLGRLEEALVAYTQSLANRAPDDIKGRTISHKQLAMCLADLGRYLESDASYAAALAMLPDDAVSWYNRSLDQNSWAQAEANEGRRAGQVEHLTLALEYARRALAINAYDLDTQHRVVNAEQALREAQGA